MRFRSVIAFVAVIAVALPGCGKSKKPVFPVSGKVMDAKDKPAVGAMVILQPVTPDPKDEDRASGIVDDSGNFRLTTYEKDDGAPAGEFIVTVIWPAPKMKPFDPPGTDLLNGTYNAKNSKIRFTVENKPQNEIPPIKVTVPGPAGAGR